MEETSSSLHELPRPASQGSSGPPALFSLEMVEIREAEGRNGRWSAASYKAAQPNAYRGMVELIGRGWGMLEVAKVFGVHHLTVAAVAEAEPELVKKARHQQVNRIKTAGHLQIERLLANPGIVPGNVAALAGKQLLELAEVMEGRASARIERVDRADIHFDWESFVEKQLQPGDDVIEIESGSDTGFAGEKISGLENSAAAIGSGFGDPVSPDSSSSAQGSSESATASAAESDGDREPISAADTTPGGDAAPPTGPEDQTRPDV